MADGGSRAHDARFGPRVAPPTEQDPSPRLIRTLDDLVAALVAVRHRRGISQLQLDELTGWCPTGASKYERPNGTQGRAVGSRALFEWLEALGLAIGLVPCGATKKAASPSARRRAA